MDGATFQRISIPELLNWTVNDLLQLYLPDSSNYEKSDAVSFLNIIVQAIVSSLNIEECQESPNLIIITRIPIQFFCLKRYFYSGVGFLCASAHS